MIGLGDVLDAGQMPSVLKAYLSRDADISFNFMVLVDGLPLGDFYGVENINRTVEPFAYAELGKNDTPHQLMGQAACGQVVLKWGMMNRGALWDWIQEVKVGGPPSLTILGKTFGGSFRKDVMVMQMTRGKIPVRAYNFRNAWPVRWAGANLDAMSSTTAVEELELIYEALEVYAIPLPF
jgi:phage tail-like protein